MRTLLSLALLGWFWMLGSSLRAESLTHSQILSKLENTEIGRVAFREVPMPEVLEYLSQATGIAFVATPAVQAGDYAVTLNLNAGLSAKSLIKLIAKLTHTRFMDENGVIYVGTPEEMIEKPVLRVYDVSMMSRVIPDYPGPEILLTDSGVTPEDPAPASSAEPLTPDDIAALIQEFCGGDTWETHPDVSIDVHGNDLLVMQSPDVHREIERLLNQLR